MRYKKPEFINRDVQTRYLGSGNFCSAIESTHMPEELRERVPHDYALKVYNFPNTIDAQGRKIYEQVLYNLAEDENPDQMTMMDKARLLKQRNERMSDYFKDELPEFIVPSTYIVSRDSAHKERVYEIQKKVSGKLYESYTVEDFLELSGDQRRGLIAELKKFLQLFRAMEDDGYYKEHIPDLHTLNIIITDDGKLRCIDTDGELPVRNERQRHVMSGQYTRLRKTFLALIEGHIQEYSSLLKDDQYDRADS